MTKPKSSAVEIVLVGLLKNGCATVFLILIFLAALAFIVDEHPAAFGLMFAFVVVSLAYVKISADDIKKFIAALGGRRENDQEDVAPLVRDVADQPHFIALEKMWHTYSPRLGASGREALRATLSQTREALNATAGEMSRQHHEVRYAITDDLPRLLDLAVSVGKNQGEIERSLQTVADHMAELVREREGDKEAELQVQIEYMRQKYRAAPPREGVSSQDRFK